jgi:hypothetical protein
MFVPLANVFAFGYLYHFLRHPRYATDGGVNLPEWEDWTDLFFDGLRLLFFVFAYVGICLFLSLSAECLIVLGSLGLFHLPWRALLPLMAVLLLPGLLVCLAQYQRRERFRDLLNFPHMLHYLRFVWWPMVWPALGFMGLLNVCQLLYGVAWFIGFGVVFASYNELLRHFGDRIDPEFESRSPFPQHRP